MTVFEVNCLRCGATYLIPRGPAPLADVYSRRAVEWLNSHECQRPEGVA